MRTTLRICGSNRKTPAIRVTMDEGKRKSARPHAGGWLGSGLPRRSLFPEGRTYSPPPKCCAFWRRWYPSLRSGRALCEADAGAFRSLRRTTDDAGKAPLVRAAVSAVMDSASRNCRDAAAHCTARHLLLQNLSPAGFVNIKTKKGCDRSWQSTIWKQRS